MVGCTRATHLPSKHCLRSSRRHSWSNCRRPRCRRRASCRGQLRRVRLNTSTCKRHVGITSCLYVALNKSYLKFKEDVNSAVVVFSVRHTKLLDTTNNNSAAKMRWSTFVHAKSKRFPTPKFFMRPRSNKIRARESEWGQTQERSNARMLVGAPER